MIKKEKKKKRVGSSGRKKFFQALEDKFFELGTNFLKVEAEEAAKDLKEKAVSFVEQKVSWIMEKRTRQYKKKIAAGLLFFLGWIFVLYGMMQVLFSVLSWSNTYLNLSIGLIFLIISGILKIIIKK